MAIVQLKEPITPSPTLDHACLPPDGLERPRGYWWNHLPLHLHAWGWGMRVPDDRYSEANRLHHTEVVTKPLPAWSRRMHHSYNYTDEALAVGTDRMPLFFIFSPDEPNRTIHFGDSGSGVVLRRGRQAGQQAIVGDVLYGISTYGSANTYSTNESGGVPEQYRLHAMVGAVPHILGGELLGDEAMNGCGEAGETVKYYISDLCAYLRLCGSEAGTRSGSVGERSRLRTLGTVYLPRVRSELPAIQPYWLLPLANTGTKVNDDWLGSMTGIVERRKVGERKLLCLTIPVSHGHLLATRRCLTERLSTATGK